MAQIKTDAAQMQTMGIGAQPLRRRVVHSGGVLDLTAVGVHRLIRRIKAMNDGIRSGVPAPLRQGRQGDGFLIQLWKGLQSGGICGKSELAVAHGQGRPEIHGLVDRIMAADQSPAIDPFYSGYSRAEKKQGNEHGMYTHGVKSLSKKIIPNEQPLQRRSTLPQPEWSAAVARSFRRIEATGIKERAA
ncbi:MAG: hypothetical protein BWY83_00972 [bacterium ADurb.Bin478]|nr:MAG: hypothetical protein BWY83_00972 [bacterium ADurb.Bin478]